MKSERLKSLDALRGFDMLWIIGGEFVIRNLAKATDWKVFNVLAQQTIHKSWEGFHFYDLIMPLFLFMVGMSIPFSFNKRISLGESRRTIYFHSFKRAVILFILGMVCQCNLLAIDPDDMFLIHDTLQAIAIGYFFSTLIYSTLKIKAQLIFTFGLVGIYWAIMQFVPVPGYEAGICTHEINPAKYIDKLVLGKFDDPTADYTWVLSSLGFVATVMTGVFASTIIRAEKIKMRFVHSQNSMIHKTVILAILGACMVTAGQVLNIWYPIIKRLWSASFILHSSGLSFLLISVFYYLIDVKGYQRWAFWLRVIGMNSIAVYMASYLFPFQKIGHIFIFGLEQYTGSFYPVLNSIVSLAFVYLIMYWMYKKKTFVKV
ncbi:DUF5009 domain-containing protein [uncultured Sunxiuqinia sp.]|uniref:acyltransferase family protein n=1 Tax=uncultured Sunxiuqinia sp. TaxID=1573825 RepID=UPI002617AC3C|nr:DUF5009 domain-containing protein [uncultured Sunxiuqinia sp.]